METEPANEAEPVRQLIADRSLARDRKDPCANLCTLANVNSDGDAEARTVILREIDEQLAVFINATSPKWQPVVSSGVSIVVWLPTVNVQYRLTCRTEPVASTLVAESWQLRPNPPKRMDWFYTLMQPQSSPVSSRRQLLEDLDSVSLPEPLTAPDTARGLYLIPSAVERLDLGQENGIHDRRRYLKQDSIWIETVLTP
jgi:pyridoxine/pyridoxamine 5'-phosphate oxidase